MVQQPKLETGGRPKPNPRSRTGDNRKFHPGGFRQSGGEGVEENHLSDSHEKKKREEGEKVKTIVVEERSERMEVRVLMT